MNVEEKFSLITRHLQEVLGEGELREKLKKKKKISLYWGTMPTGSVSIAYFFPMLKIADFLRAGLHVTILLADLHAALDSVPFDELDKRYAYYKEALLTILKTIGVDASQLTFVRGKEIQLNGKYFYDLLQLAQVFSVRDATKSASEAVKSAKGESVKLSGLIYPLMQALDEQYLDVDIQFAGLDQRKILVAAREFLPKINYEKRIELMTPMIRGLVGKQMSSSRASSKIDLLDSEEEVNKKINQAECVAGNLDNGLLSLLKYLIMVIKEDKGDVLNITRDEQFGGDITYSSYKDIEQDFISKKLHPLDLKRAVAREINDLLRFFRANKTLVKLYKVAYGS